MNVFADEWDDPFPTPEGWRQQYRRLCAEVLGRPDLATAPDYATNRKRAQNRGPLVAEIGAVFATAPTAHWLERLAAAHVPAGKVRKVSEAFREQPDLAGPMVAEVPHPELGRVKVVGSPLRFSDSRLHPRLDLGRMARRDLPRLLGFRSERGRNYSRVFGDLAVEVGRLVREEGRDVAAEQLFFRPPQADFCSTPREPVSHPICDSCSLHSPRPMPPPRLPCSLHRSPISATAIP